jgi:hypothetical protein
MSENHSVQWAELARSTALEAVWAQWSALNPMLLRERDAPLASSVIDPEALLLASMALWEEERRLVDVVAWWALRGAMLLSARRLDTIATDFPAAALQRIQTFGGWATAAGDLRWKKRGAGSEEVEIRTGKGPSELGLLGPPTLLLRLRAGFGVSAKPDVFGFLLAHDGEGITPKDIARSVGYAEKNVRVAARELALGGFIQEQDVYPVAYATRQGFSKSFLRLLTWNGSAEKVPDWNHWSAIYAFLLQVGCWAQEARRPSGYMLSSRARELFEEYRWVFRRAELKVPDPNRFPGEHYLGAFTETLKLLSRWVAESV